MVKDPVLPEPLARRVLRIGFGALWFVDGLLQLQSAMPLGMPGGVLQPAGDPSRGWVQAVVNFGVELWEKHPVQAAAATVWIQLGIGAMLLVASRGRWSRLAGCASVAWGLVVWSFGEGFGGIFAPGAVVAVRCARLGRFSTSSPEPSSHFPSARGPTRGWAGASSSARARSSSSWRFSRHGPGEVSGRGASGQGPGRSHRCSARCRPLRSRTHLQRLCRRSSAST